MLVQWRGLTLARLDLVMMFLPLLPCYLLQTRLPTDLFITNDGRFSGLKAEGVQFIVPLDRAPI
jgi:hypothetical protein